MRPGRLLRRPLTPLCAAAAATTLLLAGCVATGTDGGPTVGAGGSEQSDGGGSDAREDGDPDRPELAELGRSAAQDLPTDPATDPAYAEYYDQDIAWEECEDVPFGQDLECGSVTVPVQWDDPGAGNIDLAVARHAATGDRIGSLLLNPGGPGGSGVVFAASAPFLFSQEVQQAYDLVGFDPRGVSRSAGIDCLDDAETDEFRAATVDTSTAEGKQAAIEMARELGESCEADSGDLLPYVDTYSVARDLDVLRSAVDSEQLDYFGFSYGTYLGATYADLYPQRVGRFVLDAALDPSITLDELTAGQAAGFEQATDVFLEDCLGRGDQCPFKGDAAEAKAQLHAFFALADENPLDTGDPQRPLTGALARSAVLLLMYDDAYWQMGRDALAAAMTGDGAPLLEIADLSADRNPDGTYNGNSTEVITAINCLDHPGIADEEWQDAEAERLAQEYPTFGDSMGYGATTCAQWPVPPVREPAPTAADGAGPIVVIGTTGDPATPYEWSQNMAEQLSSGVLLTYDGPGHTAYGRSGGCIEEQVDAYLLEGTVPEDGLVC